MLRWIRRILAPPVFPENAEKTREAWLLNIILLTLFARAVLIRLVTGTDPPRPSFVVPFLILLLVLMVVMRRGAVRLSSWMTVLGFWLSLSAAAIVTGGLHSNGFRNYILPVIVGGLLLGQRAAIGTAALSIVASLGMWVGETQGWIDARADSTSSPELLVTHAVSLLMAAVLVTLTTRSINQALHRAHQEIADRKQAEAAVRSSEERFSKAFNLSPLRMGIIRLRDFKILAVNDCWVREMGFAREEVIGKPILGLTEWLGAEIPRLRQLIESGRPVHNWEGQSTTKAGEKRDSLLSVEVIELSGERCMLWAASDITDRKRADEALRESEALFRASFENATVGVCLVGTDGRFLSVNPALCEMLGYSKKELEQLSFNDVTADEDQQLGSDFVTRAIAGDIRTAHFEKRYLRKDGRVIWGFVSSAFVRHYREGRNYFITYIQDITERKEAEERLKSTSEELRALMTSLRSAREEEGIRIAREIHDELGSKLTSLRWGLEEMDRAVTQVESDPTLRPALHEKINTMVGTVDTTIDTVRRISSELRPSILDDLGLAAAVEWRAQQFQSRTGITCRYDCSADTENLDPEQSTAIFRIFEEALTNVLRHAQADRIDVSLEDENHELVLRVRDNGKGIRDYEKTSQSSLGLLGMRERAYLLGGRVDITGVEGQGTTINLYVPHTRKPAKAG
jgi:PAS domain S-box-containing protein